MTTPDAIYVANPLQLELENRPPRDTALTEGLIERAAPLWSNGSGTRIGYWDCVPGSFELHCDGYTESCQLLAGRIRVQVEGREPVTLTVGDTLVMPSGWRGIWHVEAQVRKLFVIVDD